MINTVKGKALEVAEYLTPVLKVSGEGLAYSALAGQSRSPAWAGGARRTARYCLRPRASGPVPRLAGFLASTGLKPAVSTDQCLGVQGKVVRSRGTNVLTPIVF